MIEVDRHASNNFNEEFAGEAFQTKHQDQAAEASATCCHTFKSKK